MFAWIPALIGAFSTVTASLVGRVLLALGLGFVTYTGMDTVGTYAFEQVKNSFSGLSAEALGLLGYLWVDKALNVIFSGYTTALAIKAAGASSITKLVQK